MAVADLSSAKHKDNNQACSLEVSFLSSNPCETSFVAPLETANYNTGSQRCHRGRVFGSHTSSLSVYYMINPGRSKNNERKKSS